MPNVSNDEVNMKSYCSRDPRRLPEFVWNKFIQLKEIASKAAVLSSVSIKLFEECIFTIWKNPIHKRILITCVKLPKIKVCLTHGKHIGLGELHHHFQKQTFQLTNVHLQSLLLQISCSTTHLLEVKLLIMAKTWKNMPENHFKHFFENFIETGLHVNSAFMFLWLSPDGLVTCDHQPAILEIKCPIKYRKSLKKWSTDKDFLIDRNGEMRRNHHYYFQIQHQMLITGVSHVYFYVWTPSAEGDIFVCRSCKRRWRCKCWKNLIHYLWNVFCQS